MTKSMMVVSHWWAPLGRRPMKSIAGLDGYFAQFAASAGGNRLSTASVGRAMGEVLPPDLASCTIHHSIRCYRVTVRDAGLDFDQAFNGTAPPGDTSSAGPGCMANFGRKRDALPETGLSSGLPPNQASSSPHPAGPRCQRWYSFRRQRNPLILRRLCCRSQQFRSRRAKPYPARGLDRSQICREERSYRPWSTG
jgi:hypothetical protein